MKPLRVLLTSILSLITLSTSLHAEEGESRLPIAKKSFELTYYDIRAEIIEELPNRMFIVDFDITEDGSVENAIKYSPTSFNVYEINNSEELLFNPNKLTSIKENLNSFLFASTFTVVPILKFSFSNISDK